MKTLKNNVARTEVSKAHAGVKGVLSRTQAIKTHITRKACETSKREYKTDAFSLIETLKKGIDYNFFLNAPGNKSFNLHEWSDILHVSERTLQRYKKESLPFEPLQSEKILQIAVIFQKGEEVFGEMDKFTRWIGEENEALGGKKPKEYLDNTFGIELIKDELVKIEYGIFA